LRSGRNDTSRHMGRHIMRPMLATWNSSECIAALVFGPYHLLGDEMTRLGNSILRRAFALLSRLVSQREDNLEIEDINAPVTIDIGRAITRFPLQ